MQGPDRVVQAEKPEIGHAGDPLVREQKADHRLGTGGETCHQRHEYEGADADGAARHFPHTLELVLLGGQNRQQHAVEGGVGVLHDEVRELVALVEEREVRRRVAQADDELVELEIGGVQKLGDQELPAVGDEALKALPGEHALGPPAHREPEDRGVDCDVQKLLENQRPDAVAQIGERDAHSGGEDRPAEGRKEEAAKLHGLCNISLLHVLDAGDDDREAQHAHHGDEGHVVINAADQRRGKEEARVQHQAEDEVKVKDGGIIQIVGVLLLDQGVGHAAVHENLENGGDGRDQGDAAVERGLQQAGENQRDDEIHHIGAAALHEPPYEIGDDRSLFVHR